MLTIITTAADMIGQQVGPGAVLSTVHPSRRPFSPHNDPVGKVAILISPLKKFCIEVLHTYA